MKQLVIASALFATFFVTSLARASEPVSASGPYDVVVPMLYSDPGTADRVAGQLFYNVTDSSFKGINKNGGVDTLAVAGSSSVTSGGTERIERAILAQGGACTSSPCTINSQSGSWLTSVTRTSAGAYTMNFAAGMFSAEPNCIVSASQPITIVSTSGTTSALGFQTYSTIGTNADAAAIRIICMGPR